MKKLHAKTIMIFISLIVIFFFITPTFGQVTHFSTVNETGKPYTIVITKATINGNPLSSQDEIAVLDSSLVAGASVYPDSFPFVITAWEKDDSQGLPGFTSTNTMIFKIWDKSEDTEYTMSAVYEQGNGTFGYGYLSACSLTYKTTVPPTVSAAASPDSGVFPLAVSFTATANDADGTIASYSWTFGDGSASTDQNPAHIYQTAGNFTAKVTVTDNDGLTASDSVTIKVTTTNISPTISASASPDSGETPLTVNFTATANDADGTIVSYSWTFGDGSASTDQNPAHIYQTAGNFTAKVTVTDNDGLTASDSVSIKVTTTNVSPTVSASASPDSGDAPLTVNFTATANDADGTVVLYSWSFGDDSTGTGQNPVHVYEKRGTYKSVVTVTDNEGATGKDTVTVKVTGLNIAPTITASASPDSGRAPLSVTFTATANDPDGTVISYSWNFGDGESSTDQNPAHTYQSEGTYNSIITVTDNEGGTGVDTVVIEVSGINIVPTVTAAASPDSGIAPLTVNFTATANDADGSIVSYAWNFGDDSTSTDQNPSHIYQNSGNYTARVTVTDNEGASVQDSVTIKVIALNIPPTVTASASPDSGITPLAVSFSASGNDSDGSIVSYAWNFGDGGTSSEQNPSHIYTSQGTYTAIVAVTDNDGATGSDSVDVKVTAAKVSPAVTVAANPVSGEPPLTVNFTAAGSDADGSIVSYSWAFGDGGTSNLQNPSHVYQSNGTYLAIVIVTDNDGLTGSDSINIYVSTVTDVVFSEVSSTAGTGVTAPYSTNMAWGDYDNDGDLDLYVTNWGTATGVNTDNVLFRNNNDGTFSDVAAAANVLSSAFNSICAVWGDYDNDGDLDLYISNFFDQDQLYKNKLIEQGTAVFENVTGAAGINTVALGNESAAVWGDFDSDGYLDIYISKYYAENQLYRNNQNGGFTNVTSSAGVGDIRDSEGANWIDYNNDGLTDLYVINREQDNKLYKNNGDGTFTEIAGNTGTDDTGVGKNGVWGDFNNDGFFDLFIANIGYNSLYRNSNGSSFSNIATSFNISTTSIGWESWDADWADIDGDGDLDIAVVGGGEAGGPGNAVFENRNTVFSDITDLSGILRGPWSNNSYSTAISFADYDGDGDPDFYVANQYGAQSNFLYKNLQTGANFVKVKATGKGEGGCNVSGIGSVVKLFHANNPLPLAVRSIQSGAGPLEVLFGIPSSGSYSVEVTFHGSGKKVSKIVENYNSLIIISEDE